MYFLCKHSTPYQNRILLGINVSVHNIMHSFHTVYYMSIRIICLLKCGGIRQNNLLYLGCVGGGRGGCHCISMSFERAGVDYNRDAATGCHPAPLAKHLNNKRSLGKCLVVYIKFNTRVSSFITL